MRRRRPPAADPGEDEIVVGVEQGLELGKFRRVERLDMGVGVAAEDDVELAHSPSPGAHAKAAADDVEVFASDALGCG